MPEYLSPGVYVEEVDTGAKPIEGVGTTTVGFIGETERGSTAPKFIGGFAEYERNFGCHAWKVGGDLSTSYLPYAVEGFFANGGRRCFVVRIDSSQSRSASESIGGLKFTAVGPGTWGDRIGIKVSKSNRSDDLFKITVFYWREDPPTPVVDPTEKEKEENKNRRDPIMQEEYDDLSADSNSRYFIENAINGKSALITVEVRGKPETGLKLLDGGRDGKVRLADYKGIPGAKPGEKTGLDALAEIDEVSMVCAPNEHDVEGVTGEIVTHCEMLKDRFAILQAPSKVDQISSLRPPKDSKYAAFYYPWIQIIDPSAGTRKLVPPCGHIAGIYARSDIERGVHKAPANEVVRGAVALQCPVTSGLQDLLNPRGINCIRTFIGRGIRVWGARTASSDPLWKYVNIRRLFIFIEESIEEATQWVVFEPNDERLWARLIQSVSDFLTRVWRDGALAGSTPEEAFFVQCAKGVTMVQSDLDNGRLIVRIGIAPVKPAEFVIFRIAQWPGGSAAME